MEKPGGQHPRLVFKVNVTGRSRCHHASPAGRRGKGTSPLLSSLKPATPVEARGEQQRNPKPRGVLQAPSSTQQCQGREGKGRRRPCFAWARGPGGRPPTPHRGQGEAGEERAGHSRQAGGGSHERGTSPKRLVWATTSPVSLCPPPDPEKCGGLNWVVGAVYSAPRYSTKAVPLK